MNNKKNVLITGATGFLGRVHTEAALEMGLKVILLDLNKKKLNETVKFFKNKFHDDAIISFKADITNEKLLNKISKYLIKRNIYIDILINNAAIDTKVGNNKKVNFFSLQEFPLKSWEEELNVGLKGTFLCCKVFGNHMIIKKSGNIVNIGSDLSVIAPNQKLYAESGFKNFVKPVTYSIIKHGIVGLTKYIASSWSEFNIRSNCLSPGPVYNKQHKSFVRNLNKLIPSNRMADVSDIKEAIKFLISDQSSYLNGHNLVLDGGRTII